MSIFLVSLVSFLVGAVFSAWLWFRWARWWLRQPGNWEWLLGKLHNRDPDAYHRACALVCARPVDTSSEERH